MKKRLLSWLLVLTMITSLIPSTLVTAFAAENPSAQASGQAGKTTHTMVDELPSDLSAYDIWDVRLTKDTQPGGKITVPNGKTLIIHGTGGIAGGTRNDTIVFVEKGGHLVLDGVLIQNNAVGSYGAIYVKSGGLLDLGYNDQSERRAPSITNNKFNDAAKNLVIEDGATVRLNAQADKAIGVSYYKDGIDVGPFIAISGGRYTMRGTQEGNINGEAGITSDDTQKWRLMYSYDNLIMTNNRARVLVWDPTNLWSYEGTPGHKDKLYNTIKNAYNKGFDVTRLQGTRANPCHLTEAELAGLVQYDLIVFDCATVDLTTEEFNAYLKYLNNGGRILFQVENAQSSKLTDLRNQMNTISSRIAQSLGGQFTAHAGQVVAANTVAKKWTTPARAAELTKDMSDSWGINVGAYITSSSDKVYPLMTAKTTTGRDSYVICDQDAGNRDGSQWGALTIVGDTDVFHYSATTTATSTGGSFIRNLVLNTVTRRISAAAGVNPNSEFNEWQATTTTTTTEATDYRTPYAALQKAVENNTVTLLLKSRGGAVNATRDELLFEQSTLAYEQGSQYDSSTIHADTAGVYLDITKTGEVNLYSGTVTVTPKDATYPLVLNGTMDTDGNAITGGYKITSATKYQLIADDATSPILSQNGGKASIVIPNVGESVTVDYGNGKTITYTAKEQNEKVYLGWYRVIYAQDSTANYTPATPPTYASNFEQLFTPSTGYEMNGGSFRVALWNEGRKDWDEINIVASDADSVAGEKTVWKSDDGKVLVEQTYNKTGLSTGVTVKVNDVKQDIKIYTTDKAMVETNPNITLRGVGTDKTGQQTDLYSLPTTMSYKDGLTTKPIESIPWEKYKLVGVKVGLSNDALVEQDLTDANGNKDAAEALKTYTMLDLSKGSEIIVEFQYVWNWVDVTVKAALSDGTPFPGFVPEIVEMEADKLGTVKAPNLTGYEPDKTSEQITPSKTNPDQNVVTFKYTQALSKVIYKAVNEQGNELGTFDGPTIAKGEKPNLSAALAPKLTGYMVKTDSSGAKLDGVPSTDQPFDGTTPITVTFTYVPRVKTIKVYMYEYDASKNDFKGASLRFDETTYANMTTGQTLTISAPPVAGYTVKEDATNDKLRKSQSVFIKDDDTEQVVNFFYEKNAAEQKYITVKLMDTSKTPNTLIFSYKIPAIVGQAQIVSAPTTLDGYVADGTNADVTIKPEEDKGNGEGVVVFNFKPDVWTVTVKLMDNSTNPATEITTKPTNFQDTYTVTKGKEISITAPSIYGYTLALSGQDSDLNGGTLKFTPTSDTEKTIYYVPIAKEMVNIKVTGKVDGGSDLFTYTVQVAAGSKEYTIDAKENITGYKLTGATVGGTDKFQDVSNNQLTITVPDNAKGGTINVVLTYQSTKTTVTVKTACDGDDLGTTYTVEKELDQETSVFAPSIPGYTATEQKKTFTPDGTAATATQTFQYTKNTGNVVLIAKANGVELFRKDGGTKPKGDTVNAADFTAPDVTYYERTAAEPTITVDGKAFTSGSQYDGIGQIEIAYEYARKTQSVTIVKKDADTRKEIDRTQVIANLAVGESHAFQNMVTTPTGYTPESGNPTSVFVEDRAGQEVVFWYRQNEADRYVTITVNLKCGSDVFETYTVCAVKGQETTVGRPSWTGYTPVASEQAYQPVIPTDNTTVVEFSYTLDDPKTVTIKLHNNTDNKDMTAPSGYQTEYTLKNGDKVTIQAPIMSGFTLNGYTISGGTNGTSQFVEVSHANIQNGTTITFNYESVENANFVKHSVRFVDHLGNELYSYDKMIPKGSGAGAKVEYKESDVKRLIPGYALHEITYKVNNQDATADQVTNAVDAEITYVFTEDSAKIIVEQYNGQTKLTPDVELAGYRTGMTGIVVNAPARTDVALNDALTKTVTGPLTAEQSVRFEYETLQNIRFYLYDADTGNLIAIKNAQAGTTYTAGQDILDLSKDHYTYQADDRSTNPEFKTDGSGKVTAPSDATNVTEYTVYFQKATLNVEYIAMDSAKLSQNDFATATDDQKNAAKITGITPVTPAAARVGETYMATAQTFDGWTLDDDLTKPYAVADEQGALQVYFWYKQRATGTVTVNYVYGTEGGTNNDTLASYTTKAAGGEKLTITPPQTLGDGRYTLNAGQVEQTIDVDRNGTHTVNFYYSKNFVTISTKIVLGSAQPSELSSLEVLKTGTADFFPPYRPGYKLVGVTGVSGGEAGKLPDGFGGKVTISNPAADQDIVWYFQQTDATEYQSDVTVKYVYRDSVLGTEKVVKAFIGVGNTIEIPDFDGYTAKSYTFKDGSSAESGATEITDASAGVTVTPNKKTAILTITYVRPDGSVVLPGKDNEIAAPKDKDNVTVTPDDPNKVPADTGDGSGSVKVPDDTTATVTRPIDPDQPDKGSEDIKVPGGTVIKPDGTIELPENGGTIGPEQKIPENLPKGYVAITYDSNNSNQEVKKEIGKAGELKVSGSLFTDPSNRSFAGWNDSGSGNGKTYAKDTTVSANITLYAVWDAQYRYSTNIIYNANDGTTKQDTQLVGHATDPVLKGKLQNSPFQVSGWTFGGWNEAANGSGTLYQPGNVLTLENKVNKTLFAQWFKTNADGSITVPGSDGNPNNPDTNATGNGNGTENPRRNDKGEIEIPKGGSVTLPDGSVIGMPDGGKLLPDGTVIINRPDTDKDGKSDGTITIPGTNGKPDVTDKDGNEEQNKTVYTLTYTINNGENTPDVVVKVVDGDKVAAISNPFKWDGHTFINWLKQSDSTEVVAGAEFTVAGDETFHAQWIKQNTDGSVELPGKDGSLAADEDNVIVTPDNHPVGNLEKKDDGSVEVKGDGATVNRPTDPDHPENGREDVKVPEGSIVKPDGTIILPNNGGTIKPGDKLPGATPTGYISVVYKANGGSGDDVIVLVKNGETTKAIKNPFKAVGSAQFTGWNTAENGIGGTAYAVDANIPSNNGNVTLYAQWSSNPTYAHSAKIIYQANDGATDAIEDTVGANDSTKFSINLRSNNTFVVNGWSFGGWNTEANGTGDLKAANAVIEVTANVDQTWYAQWYKTNADSSITVPGKDGNPNTADDNVTANGNPVRRDDTTGNIEIPAGGSVITPNGEITLPDGGILKPDGTVIINLPDTNNNGKPDNTITVPGANGTDPDVKDENGNIDNTKTAVVLTYQANNGSGKEVKVYTVSGNATQALAKDTFMYSGHKFLYWQSGNTTYKAADEITPNGDMTLSAVWAKVNPDGSIELPGEDGKLEAPHDKDNVIVTPDNKDGLEGPKDDGSVEVKPDHEATVTRPDPTKPGTKEDVKVPAGTVILPDGTIKLPAPDNTEIKPGDKIPETTTAYVTITFAPGNGTGSTIKQIVTKNSKINLLDESTFTAPDNHYFVGWKDADGKSYDAGVEYDVGTAAVTFTAQYQDRDNLTKAVAIFDYAGGTDINGDGSKYVTGKADAAITGITAPTRTGYTFAGWDNADLKFGASGSVTVFTAQWTIKSYDVTFDVGDNTKGTMSGYTTPVTVEYGKSVASADIPSITASAGNVFVGWLNSSDNSVYTADSLKNYVVTGNVTFTAQYVDASLATVIFVYAGGTLNGEHSKLVSATEGSAIGTLPEPTRDGYTLTGWTPAIADNATFGAAGTVTVYTAEWDENEKQPLTVTFEIDATKGSTADTTTETVADGGFVTKVPTVTAKAGYRFVGWMDQDNKLFYEAGVLLYPITKATTFTAQFEEVTANPGTATVIFDANGGKIGNNSVLTKVGVPGTVVGIPTEPTRNGYKFLGWSGGFDASTVYGAESTTQTYTAQWEAIEYTIHFSATGASGATADQTYKFDSTTKNTLNRNGFTLTGKDFLGWSLTDGATTADFADGALINDTLRTALAASNGSITLYAVWADGVNNNLTVTGSKATAKRDETVDFTAYLNGVATDDVTWIVTGGQSGTHIDANGVLTIGSNESNGTVLTVTAIYKNDTSLTANATVRVVVNSNNNGGNNGGGTVSSSFVIKASAGNGGIISPSGNVSVKRGDDQTFVINPVNGYRIADVIVDGKSVDAVSLYTFENVRANHTIEVVFTKLNSIVADPTETGVAGWLQTREHIAYLGGYGNGLFGPNDNMTRAQVAQMFYNLLLEKDIPVTTSFSDVPADAWYAKAVNTLASLGIIKGIGNDQFAPNRTITRAEFTVIAMRFANVSATVTNPFSDIASSDWYYTAVTSAVSYGWITGYSDGTFKPMATITRAEVATIVNRMLARTADRNFVDSSAVTRFDDVPATYWAYYNIAEATTAHTHTIDNDGVESWGRLM